MSNGGVFQSGKPNMKRYGTTRETDYEHDEVIIDRTTRSNCAKPCRPACPKPCPPDPCDPCARKNHWGWFFWAGLVIFIILAIGLYIIRPHWLLDRGLDGLVVGAGCISWLKLLVWSLILTLLLLFIAWIFKILADSSAYGWY